MCLGFTLPFRFFSFLPDVTASTSAGATKHNLQPPSSVFFKNIITLVWPRLSVMPWLRMKPQKMRGKISSIIPALSQFTVCLRFFFFLFFYVCAERSASPFSFVLFSSQVLIFRQAARTLPAGSPDKSPLIHHPRSVNFPLCCVVVFFSFFLFF